MQEVTIDVAAKWRDEYLPNIFTDPRFRQISRFRYYAEIDGIKAGIVLATWTQYGNFALNRNDNDRVLTGKRNGRIDLAYIVKAVFDAETGALTYRKSYDAEQLYNSVLTSLTLLNGKLGPFWALPSDPDDEPF
jgi:hypothetical protein